MNMKAFIIGFGSMGKKHFEVLKKLLISDITVFDLNPQLCTKDTMVTVKDISILESELINEQPGLVIIATNADSHFDYIKICLQNNVTKVLCEKPLYVSINQIFKLRKLAIIHSKSEITIN